MRRSLITLAILNAIIAIAVAFAGPVLVQTAFAAIMSKYRTLDTRGVIDRPKLEAEWGPSAAEDWGVAVDHLVGEPLRGLATSYYWIAGLFCVNAFALFFLYARCGKSDTLRSVNHQHQRAPSSPDDDECG